MCDPYNSHNQYDIKRSILVIFFSTILYYMFYKCIKIRIIINFTISKPSNYKLLFQNGIITLKILQKFYIKRINQSII